MTLPRPKHPSGLALPPLPEHHKPDDNKPQRRSRAFPVFTAEQLARLVELAKAEQDDAVKHSRATLAVVASLLVVREAERRPFLRWCHATCRHILAPGSHGLREAILMWHSLGRPDGIDCCLLCGHPTWVVDADHEAVLSPAGGFAPTGRILAYGRCGRGCFLTGTLIDAIG